ncbi:hypothetical protein KKI17_01575 [Patescibacteria group bacterium]|nr:hypothetical protein [Patescibacteria group bacterium]
MNQLEYLRRAVEAGKLSHAYLFTGNDGELQEEAALFLLRHLLCEGREKPCSSCRQCRIVSSRTHPDVSWVVLQEGAKEISIEQVRELRHTLSFTPYEAPLKTAVIPQAHLMNEEAQAALLKTFEEPRGRTLLLLLSTSPGSLLAPLRSRTQEVPFWKFPRVLSESKEAETELRSLSAALYVDRFRFAKEHEARAAELVRSWLVATRSRMLQELTRQGMSSRLQYLRKLAGLLQEMERQLGRSGVNARLILERVLLEL